MVWKKLLKVARFAKEKHSKQKRDDGSPYFSHPARMVQTLWISGFRDLEVLQTAYLHDLIEDCDVSFSDIENLFGKELALNVASLTNNSPSGTPFWTKHEEFLKTKLNNKSKIVKLADRYDNLNDSVAWNLFRRKRYARAALELIGHLYPWEDGEKIALAIRELCENILEKN